MPFHITTTTTTKKTFYCNALLIVLRECVVGKIYKCSNSSANLIFYLTISLIPIF